MEHLSQPAEVRESNIQATCTWIEDVLQWQNIEQSAIRWHRFAPNHIQVSVRDNDAERVMDFDEHVISGIAGSDAQIRCSVIKALESLLWARTAA